MTVARVLLAASALILLAGGLMHASAFRRFDAAVAAASMPAFFANSARGLWLIDSATQLILGVIFVWLASRPGGAARPVVVMLGLIPTATAALIYGFVGNFIAGHLLLAAGALAIVSALF